MVRPAKRIFAVAAFVFAAGLSLPGLARADGAFHWKDSNGSDHYGSNPPKGALNVESLGGNRVSRYSSKRIFQNAHTGVVSETEITSQPPPAEKLPNIRTITKGQTGAVKPTVTEVPSIKEEPLIPELTEGELTVKHDAQKRVTDCSVIVANKAAIPAQNVLVSFEFEDGTLVPGVGPASIDADSTAKYSIPQEMLPISVQGKTASDPKGPRPKVSITAGAE